MRGKWRGEADPCKLCTTAKRIFIFFFSSGPRSSFVPRPMKNRRRNLVTRNRTRPVRVDANSFHYFQSNANRPRAAETRLVFFDAVILGMIPVFGLNRDRSAFSVRSIFILESVFLSIIRDFPYRTKPGSDRRKHGRSRHPGPYP